MDPEGNWVIMGRRVEGGPGPPSGDQDKQLVCSSGGGKTPMGEQGEQQDGSGVTSRAHHAKTTVKSGNLVTFFTQNIYFLKLS